jgi:hypothetical protein
MLEHIAWELFRKLLANLLDKLIILFVVSQQKFVNSVLESDTPNVANFKSLSAETASTNRQDFSLLETNIYHNSGVNPCRV